MKQQSLKKNAFFNVLKTVMNLIFPLITFPYASRILLPDGIGKVNFANSIISYFSIIASLGLGTYGTREAARVREDPVRLSKVTKELFTINIISTIIAYFLFFISLFSVPKFKDYRSLLCVCSGSMLFTTIGINWLYDAFEQYRYITIRSILTQLFSLCCLFIFVHNKNDYIKYAAISIIATAGANVFNIFHAREFVSFHLYKGKLELKKHIKPIFIFFASTIAVSIFTILDTSMLGFISNDTEVGYYSAASKIVYMVRNLFPAVFGVMFARMSLYSTSNNNEKILHLTEKTVRFIVCFTLPICAGMLILIRPVVILLCGEQYIPAIPTAVSMIPLVFFSSLSGFIGGELLVAKGREKSYLYVTVAAALLDILLNIPLIHHYGAFGASIATTAVEIFIFITYFILTHHILRQIKIKLHFMQSVISTIIMGGVVYGVSLLFHSIILQIIIPTLSGILTYALVLYIVKNEFFMELVYMIKSSLIKKLYKKNRGTDEKQK